MLIQVDRDQEVVQTIETRARELGIANGGITLIGAVHEVAVSVMRKSDAKDDLLREYAQPFELSGTGEILDGAVHAHVTLFGEDLTIGGHLHSATVRDFFVRAYVTPIESS